jgi:hypothetical protein
VGRNVSLQIIRGVKANMPMLAIGELFWATDVLQMYTGSSGGNKLVGPLPVYNAAGVLQQSPHIVVDTVTIGGGGSTTVTLTQGFASATSYRTVTQCTNAKHSCQVVQNSGTSITFMGAGGDVYEYIAIGN